MNVITLLIRRAFLVPALAVLVGQAHFTSAQTLLLDFGSDTSYRGLSVEGPDTNGNYWTSLQPGLFVENLVDIDNVATTIDVGWDTPVGTDSYNGPAGETDENFLETDVMFTVIDPIALGNLGGSFEGVFDFAAGYDGINHFPVRFQIQGLNPAAAYNLTFFGSHKFSNDSTTLYKVFTDNTYTTQVASTSLLVQDPFFEHNQDRIATIDGVSPQTDAFLYIEFVGENGFGGYLNAMQIEAVAPALQGNYNGDNKVDGADLTVWKGQFGNVGTGLAADGDGDSDADGADFLIWQRNFGAMAGATAAAAVVPEPASAALLLAGLLALPAASRRRTYK